MSKRARRLAREYNIKIGMSEALVKVADELLDMGKQAPGPFALSVLCSQDDFLIKKHTSSDLFWGCCNDEDAAFGSGGENFNCLVSKHQHLSLLVIQGV